MDIKSINFSQESSLKGGGIALATSTDCSDEDAPWYFLLLLYSGWIYRYRAFAHEFTGFHSADAFERVKVELE